jgi:hypothetical protein
VIERGYLRGRYGALREVQRLLQEFDAPDIRTLWRHICFWAYFYISCGIMLGGLVALYDLFGLPAMWLGVAAIYALYLWTLRRTPVYLGEDDDCLFGSNKPALPPPGKQALPSPSTPRLPPPGIRAVKDNRSHTRR